MTHFTDIEIHRWRASGVGSDRDRALRHAAECADCAARFAAAIRGADLDAALPADDVADFVAVGRRYARSAASPLRRFALIASAAAALALVGVVVSRIESETPPAAETTLRGTAIDPRAPSGTVDASGLRFVWSAGVSASRFRVDVGDASGIVCSGGAAQSPWTPSADAARQLRPGVDYWWTVTALDAAGAPITTSPRRAFALSPPR